MNLSGSPLDFIFAFAAGVLVSFNPCVFPLIPVTLGYIGVSAAKSRFQGFALSMIYVTGIAVTYSMLGLIASLTGQLFGRISSSPLTYISVGAVIVVFGLSMCDLFYIPFPSIIRLPNLKKQGYFSAFILGLASGMIIGPCVSPALAAVLAYLVTKKNILYGMTLLLSFAYGMGLFLVILGTFSSISVGFLKSGRRLLFIKRISAFILIGAGVYFVFIGIRRF